ncbi:MAG: SPOR domain-containing protein [Fimbriimonadaceae bacterium]|nr:SPOR domain-containing protein [Chitinophagales bacterium]
MNKNFVLVFILITTLSAFAQTGKITITDNAGANDLVNRHIYFNKEHSELPGWRIQVLSTNSLMDAKDEKSGFLSQYEDLDADIVFEAPNYKLRIGNYHNRFDANRDLQLLIVHYPNAFICKDMIKINDN